MSPNRKGRLEELIEDYERIHVPEVWLVYPEQRSIRRLLLQDGKLTAEGTYSAGLLAPRFAPEASVDLNELWADRATRP